MAIRKYDISLDTKVRISNVVIRGRLGDGKGSIVANVTVFNDGQRYNFTGLTPQYEAKLSDDLNIIRDKAGFSEVKAAEGSFTYEFPAELFSAEGYAKASYFTFLDAKGSKQSTFDIAVEVVGMALAGKLAETYVSEIDVDLKGLSKEVTSATTAANKVIADIAKNNVVQQKDYYPLISGAGTRTKLADGTDLLTLETGYYEVTKCKNSPFPDTDVSWKNIDVIDGREGRKMLRLTVSDSGDTFYKTLHTNSAGGRDWWQAANTSDLQSLVKSSEAELWQKQKITNDDGSTITITDYDLLNTTDVANFDGYVTTAGNAPTSSNSGYYKRKYRAGYVEVTYSPHSTKDVYRNSYNGVAKNWVGWEKLVTASELTAIKPVTIWQGAANGVSNTTYNLTAAINTFRVAMVTYKTASGNNKVQTFSVAKDSSRMIISETNLSDDDASSAWLYECQIDASASTSFKIIKDNLFNIKTGVATTNTNTHTILKIEGVM